ncbi:T3SS (YopN, CesT) and YbjN peptide-binding chaperone 1 [Rhodococcus indonesiensis]
MTDTESRFDRDVDRSWSEFRARLADHVASMRDGDGLVLEPLVEEDTGPAGPCVQFYAWGEGQVRCEVPSNAHLDPDRRLRPGDEALLAELGWREPSRGPEDPEDGGSPAYWMDRPAAWADQLAAVAVTALRRVWGVPHPLFLRTETFGTGRADFELPPPAEEIPPQAALPLAVETAGEDHVRELIESTLRERIGDVPLWDEDGDLAVRVAGMLVFVGVGPHERTVDVFAPIVHHITGRTRAAEVVADLNRRWPHLKFVLVEDRVAVAAHLPASPFVPAHLLATLDLVAQFLEGLDEGFGTSLGGELLHETDHDCVPPPADELPPWTTESEADLPLTLLALRDLHLDGEVAVEPRTVARMADDEPDQLLRFLRLSVDAQVCWQAEAMGRAAAGDDAGTARAEAKAREWEATCRSLTAAMRLLVPPAGSTGKRRRRRRSSPPEQTELFENPDEPTLFDELSD